MKKKKINQIKLIKRHNKVRYVGKKYFYIGYNFYTKLLTIFMFINRNRKKKFKKLLRKYLFFFKLRSLYRNKLIIVGVKNVINLYKNFFFFFNLSCLISLCYYKITDYQLELVRRLAKKFFGKKIILNLCIKAQFNLIKRTNQIRMGGGKGNKLYKKIYPLYPGCIFIIIYGVNLLRLHYFYKKLLKKLSFLFKYYCFNKI